jgi:hypothetical protein
VLAPALRRHRARRRPIGAPGPPGAPPPAPRTAPRGRALGPLAGWGLAPRSPPSCSAPGRDSPRSRPAAPSRSRPAPPARGSGRTRGPRGRASPSSWRRPRRGWRRHRGASESRGCRPHRSGPARRPARCGGGTARRCWHRPRSRSRPGNRAAPSRRRPGSGRTRERGARPYRRTLADRRPATAPTPQIRAGVHELALCPAALAPRPVEQRPLSVRQHGRHLEDTGGQARLLTPDALCEPARPHAGSLELNA